MQARLCLGLYACKGFMNPLRTSNRNQYQVIEVTDNASIRRKRSKVMLAVINVICPHPIKFRQVWHFARGSKSLYAWKPSAPENFVALGMLCTTTEHPPDVTAMRCVPQKWCTPTKFKPIKIWDDTGSGGGKPASMWIVNNLGMVTIVPGHEPPTDPFFEVSSARFFLDGFNLNEVKEAVKETK